MSASTAGRRRRGPLPRPELLRAAGFGVGLLTALVVCVPAASAAPAATCGASVLLRSDTVGRTELLVAAPDLLSQLDLPASAFGLSQAGATAPLTVRRPPAAEKVVNVVLASSPTTTAAGYETARAAALELLQGLEPGTSTGLVTTGRAAPLAPLSQDPSRATRALPLAKPGVTVSTEAAVRLAGQSLPPGSHVVLFSDGTGEAALRGVLSELAQRQVVLDRVQYAAGGQPPSASGGPAGRPTCVTAGDPAVRQVDHVLAQVRGGYWVSAALAPAAAAQLSVRSAGGISSVELPAAVTSGPVLTDPYRERGSSAVGTAGRYLAAGALLIVGLLLAGVRRRPVGPALAQEVAPAAEAGRWLEPAAMSGSSRDDQ